MHNSISSEDYVPKKAELGIQEMHFLQRIAINLKSESFYYFVGFLMRLLRLSPLYCDKIIY